MNSDKKIHDNSSERNYRRSIPAATNHSRNDSQDSTWSSSTQGSSGSEYSSLSKRSSSNSYINCFFPYLRRSNSSGDNSVGSQSSHSSNASHHSKQDRRPTSTTSGENPHCKNINTTEHIEEKFVCDMKFDGCYYTGKIDNESQSPHGSGKLRSEDGTMLEAEWKWGSCTFDV